MSALAQASERAAKASTVEAWVKSIAQQLTYLTQLGDGSGAPIVPTWLRDVAAKAFTDGVAIHPSGAGGGDIVLCMGALDGCRRWQQELERNGLDRLDVKVHARGVHPCPG